MLDSIRPRPRAVLEGLAAVLAGASLAIAAWGPGRTPALVVALPWLWLLCRSRPQAFLLTAAYHLGVVRFLPGFAGTWFESPAVGLALWAGMGAVCGLVWASLWPKAQGPFRAAAFTGIAMLVLLATPVAAIVPGHPLLGWTYLLPSLGWAGVVLAFVGSIGGAWVLAKQNSCGRRWFAPAALTGVLALAWAAGDVPNPNETRLVGPVAGVQTKLGGFPPFGSLEVMERVGKIGRAVAHLAGGEGAIQTVVFPEAIIGLYDPTVYPALEQDVVEKLKETGQTVVLGADVSAGTGRYQNIAIILRPDGTSSSLAARQTLPVAQWRPWKADGHFPADWFATSTAAIGGGIRARFMFCHEEWMPVLHLISEAREDHVLVISVANLWATTDPLADFIQASHAMGMARLFGKKVVRSVNLGRPKS